MDIGAGSLRESLKKIFHEFNLETADLLGRDFCVDDAIRTATEINGGSGKRFVHGHQKISGAKNAALRTESFENGFTEGDANVFDGVVLIDVEIAARLDAKIEGAVTRDEIEHVVEKANAREDFGFATAFEIDGETDVGLVGFAMDGRCSRHRWICVSLSLLL
jgi:hypothetical protein